VLQLEQISNLGLQRIEVHHSHHLYCSAYCAKHLLHFVVQWLALVDNRARTYLRLRSQVHADTARRCSMCTRCDPAAARDTQLYLVILCSGCVLTLVPQLIWLALSGVWFAFAAAVAGLQRLRPPTLGIDFACAYEQTAASRMQPLPHGQKDGMNLRWLVSVASASVNKALNGHLLRCSHDTPTGRRTIFLAHLQTLLDVRRPGTPAKPCQ
jgi:hypothetical protein